MLLNSFRNENLATKIRYGAAVGDILDRSVYNKISLLSDIFAAIPHVITTT